MLSEYEAAMLAKQKSAGRGRAQAAPARTRIGFVLVALSVLSAVGLLYAAFFHQGPVSSATRAAPVGIVATPIFHPATSAFPEGALFLRHRSLAEG